MVSNKYNRNSKEKLKFWNNHQSSVIGSKYCIKNNSEEYIEKTNSHDMKIWLKIKHQD